MKNLEVRANGKQIWWDGEYGGIIKDGEFKWLLHRPLVDFLPTPWSQFNCTVELGVNPANFYTQINTDIPLDASDITAFEKLIDSAFPTEGGGGGSGGGGGVTNLRVSEASRAITFTDEDGRSGRLPFAEMKATPMEFYLDVSQPSVTTKFPSIAVNTEYVIPIGTPSLTGRNHYITVDRATNRVLIPEGGLRGTFRAYGGFRFNPSVKSDMAIELAWYYRRQGSSEAWTMLYKGAASRTAAQTTAALSWPTSAAYYNLPDYPIECEARIRFTKLGTVDWKTIPIFDDAGDGLKISLYRNPNFAYTT